MTAPPPEARAYRGVSRGGFARSEDGPKCRKTLHSLDEDLPEQNVETALDVHGRVLQLLPLPLGSCDDRSLIEIEEVLDEDVGMLGLESEGLQHVSREVLLVEGHAHARVAANRGREHMPIIRIGKGETGDQRLVPSASGIA